MHLAGQADAPRPSPPVRARTRAAPLPCSASSRRTENVPGEWFVDSRCIDCDACRSLAPSTFTRVAGQSAVTRQPAAVGPERLAALQAMLVCPTASIHTATPPEDVQLAHASFPVTLHHRDVLYLGYHSPKSFGAASYAVRFSDGGAVLVDSPRFSRAYADKLQQVLGRVVAIFLTHRDDVADAAQWAAHFGAPRIMHGADAGPGIEHVLHGDGPWVVRPDGTPVPAAGIDADGELVIIHVPGHTPGSACLLHKPSSTLFSGDHLAADEEGPHDMTMFESFNWYSVPKQRDSIAKLLEMPFTHVLPGHGRRASFKNIAAKDAQLRGILDRTAAIA